MNGLRRARPALLAAPALLLCALASLASPARAAAVADDPARQPPFGGEVPPPLERPASRELPPPGFGLSAERAIALARTTAVVEAELAESPGARPEALIRGDRWQVTYAADGEDVALVVIDGRSGEVEEAWRDHQVGTPLARGYDGAVAQAVNSPFVWVTLSVLLLAAFFDPRRPWRALHLDLLALLSLGISVLFFNRGEITTSVALTYPVLGWFLIRMLLAGVRPRTRPGALVPLVGPRLLAIAVLVLLAARIALNVADSQVIDVGVAGVVGADRVASGESLYEGGFSPGLDLRGDVYGPANYLAYLPFEQALPWEGSWDGVPAAHAAAIAFDLLCVIGLIALGRRVRGGGEGRMLGWALAFAWVACPFTLYTLDANANDGLIAALAVGVLLALGSPAARGALLGLAAAAKFGPAALAPLLATAPGAPRWRTLLGFGLAFGLTVALVFLPFVPDGGLGELYDRTLGYQATRNSPFSVWGLAPSLEALQPLVRAGAVALAVAVAFRPRWKDAAQTAALAAAVTIAVQLAAAHWFYFYVVWFLPFVLFALFSRQERVAPGRPARLRPGA